MRQIVAGITLCLVLLVGCAGQSGPSGEEKATAVCAGLDAGQDRYALANQYFLAPPDQEVSGGNRDADAMDHAAAVIDRACPQHWRHAELLRGMARLRR